MVLFPEDRAALTFLQIGVKTGLLLTDIALDANEEYRITRNRENARRAYESVRKFMSRIPVSDDDYSALQQKLQELEHRLRTLDRRAKMTS
jgi:hypothetical protein